MLGLAGAEAIREAAACGAARRVMWMMRGDRGLPMMCVVKRRVSLTCARGAPRRSGRCCQMSFSQFHAAEPKEGRSAADDIQRHHPPYTRAASRSRFASSGKVYRSCCSAEGDDGQAHALLPEEDEFRPGRRAAALQAGD